MFFILKMVDNKLTFYESPTHNLSKDVTHVKSSDSSYARLCSWLVNGYIFSISALICFSWTIVDYFFKLRPTRDDLFWLD